MYSVGCLYMLLLPVERHGAMFKSHVEFTNKVKVLIPSVIVDISRGRGWDFGFCMDTT